MFNPCRATVLQHSLNSERGGRRAVGGAVHQNSLRSETGGGGKQEKGGRSSGRGREQGKGGGGFRELTDLSGSD